MSFKVNDLIIRDDGRRFKITNKYKNTFNITITCIAPIEGAKKEIVNDVILERRFRKCPWLLVKL